MIVQKIIIYGAANNGKHVLAVQIILDNPYLSEPAFITTPKTMRDFLNSPIQSLGIISSTCVNHVMNKCKDMNFGNVLFISDPTIIIDPPATDNKLWDDASHSWRQSKGLTY